MSSTAVDDRPTNVGPLGALFASGLLIYSVAGLRDERCARYLAVMAEPTSGPHLARLADGVPAPECRTARPLPEDDSGMSRFSEEEALEVAFEKRLGIPHEENTRYARVAYDDELGDRKAEIREEMKLERREKRSNYRIRPERQQSGGK